MREARAALVDVFLLRLAVGERREILCALVALAIDREDFLIAVGHDHGSDDDRQDDCRKDNDTQHRQRVFEELAHAVFEEGRAFAHDVLLPLFLVRRSFELRKVDLGAQNLLFGRLVGIKIFHIASSFLSRI